MCENGFSSLSHLSPSLSYRRGCNVPSPRGEGQGEVSFCVQALLRYRYKSLQNHAALLTHNFHHYSFSPLPIKLCIINLLPGT